MKKIIRTVIITLVLLTAATVGGLYWLTAEKKDKAKSEEQIRLEESGESTERAFMFSTPNEATPLIREGAGKNLLVFEQTDIYNAASSAEAKKRLDRLVSRTSPSFDEPLIAYNPFGIMKNSLYFSFNTNRRVAVKYTITVEDETIPDFVRTVYSGQENNMSQKHEFSIGGIIPGMKNYIILALCTEDGTVISSNTYSFDAEPAVAGALVRIPVEKGKISEAEISNGLYFCFPKDIPEILCYDNAGILRGETLLEEAAGKRMVVNHNDIFYMVSAKKLVHLSPIGQVVGVHTAGEVGELLDFDYDGYGNLYALAAKKGKVSLVRTDLKSGALTKVLTFKEGAKPDSIAVPGDGSAYVGQEKPAGILRITNVASNVAKVSGVIGEKSDWKVSQKKVYQKEGKGKYAESIRLLLYNSDKGSLSFYNEGGEKGSRTGYYEYEVKDDKKTFSLFRNLKAGKQGQAGSGPGGSGQWYGTHYIIADRSGGSFGEYDTEGKLIKEFKTDLTLKSVLKMNLKQTCFK